MTLKLRWWERALMLTMVLLSPDLEMFLIGCAMWWASEVNGWL